MQYKKKQLFWHQICTNLISIHIKHKWLTVHSKIQLGDVIPLFINRHTTLDPFKHILFTNNPVRNYIYAIHKWFMFFEWNMNTPQNTRMSIDTHLAWQIHTQCTAFSVCVCSVCMQCTVQKNIKCILYTELERDNRFFTIKLKFDTKWRRRSEENLMKNSINTMKIMWKMYENYT